MYLSVALCFDLFQRSLAHEKRFRTCICSLPEQPGINQAHTPGGTRTHNRLIRSQTPCPLGHGRLLFSCIFYLFLTQSTRGHRIHKLTAPSSSTPQVLNRLLCGRLTPNLKFPRKIIISPIFEVSGPSILTLDMLPKQNKTIICWQICLPSLLLRY